MIRLPSDIVATRIASRGILIKFVHFNNEITFFFSNKTTIKEEFINFGQ